MRSGKVRDDYKAEIRECKCGLVYLANVKSCNYEKSEMRVNDSLEEVQRDDLRRFEYVRGAIRNKNVLDFGCGLGGFIAHVETIANRVCGVEADKHLIGGNVYKSIKEVEGRFDVITAWHVIEHLPDPIKTLKELKEKLTGYLYIEVPNADDALLTLYQNKAFSEFTYWSCHLHLFNSNTLRSLLQKANLEIDYIEHIQRYPLSNHLYWLANGKAGGHKIWPSLDSKDYEHNLAKLGMTDTLIARCR